HYIGPKMRVYGNMFRAVDCPQDWMRNHRYTTALRLLSDSTVAQSDMQMWHPSDSPEAAAQQLLGVLFSVPQISMKLDELPESHRAMLRFWLGFWNDHRDALLDGAFEAHSPHLAYPVVSSSHGPQR